MKSKFFIGGLFLVIFVLGVNYGKENAVLHNPKKDISTSDYSNTNSYELSEKEQSVINASIHSEVDMMVSDGEGIITLEDLGIDKFVTGQDLADAYDENEIAADEQYRSKTLLVKGSVSSIDKDFLDKPILRLKGKNMFMDLHAYVDTKELTLLAKVKKGQKVTLVCKGDGLTLGSPILKNCKTASFELSNRLSQQVTQFFSGKIPDNRRIAALVSLSLYAARNLPESIVCNQDSQKKCLEQVNQALKDVSNSIDENGEYTKILNDFEQKKLISPESNQKLIAHLRKRYKHD